MKKKSETRASSEGAIERRKHQTARTTEVDDHVSGWNLPAGSIEVDPTSRWVGMTGGIPGTGLRGKNPEIDYHDKAKSDGSAIFDDYTSPAYIRATYRHTTVKIGPPYNIGIKDTTDAPPSPSSAKKSSVWIQGADWVPEKQDKRQWQMSYASTEMKQSLKLGPGRSIRGMGQTWSEDLGDCVPQINVEAPKDSKTQAKAKAKGKVAPGTTSTTASKSMGFSKSMSGAPGNALRKQKSERPQGKAGPKGTSSRRIGGMTDSDTSPGPPQDRYDASPSPRSQSPSEIEESEEYYKSKMLQPETKSKGLKAGAKLVADMGTSSKKPKKD